MYRIFLLSFLFSVQSLAQGNMPQLPRFENATPKEAYCQLVLDIVNAAPENGSSAVNFFSALNMMLSNSSYLAASMQMAHYRNIHSLARLRYSIAVNETPTPSEVARKERAKQFYEIFKKAEETSEGPAIASLFHNIDLLNNRIDSALFFAESGGANSIRFAFSAEKENPDLLVKNIQEAWNQMSSPQRKAVLEWIGLAIYDGARTYKRTTWDFAMMNEGKADEPGVTVTQLLPDLAMNLEDFLRDNRRRGTKAELTQAFYRHIGSTIMRFYGIQAAEDLLTLPPPKPTLLQRIRGLLGS